MKKFFNNTGLQWFIVSLLWLISGVAIISTGSFTIGVLVMVVASIMGAISDLYLEVKKLKDKG